MFLKIKPVRQSASDDKIRDAGLMIVYGSGKPPQHLQQSLLIMIRKVTLNDLDALCKITEQHQALMSSIDFYEKNKDWLKEHIENNSLLLCL